ncbi:MAG: PEP-CTERM sorting domain-containing protein [bacterium]
MTLLPTRFAHHAVLVLGFMTLAAPADAQVVDNFQSYTPGQLPSPTWFDAGAVLPIGRIPPFPSGYIISTTDAFGHPTQAVTTTGALATSKGIYTNVPIANFYTLHADARVDRYSDAPDATTNDWAIQLTFGQNGVDNWAYGPQAGIYASSLTQGWRLFATAGGTSADIDLGVAAVVGTWYTVRQSFDILTGQFHSQIFDTATGTTLVDQFNTLAGWDPTGVQFDSFAFFGGDLSPDDTVGNIGVIDNVNITAVTTPEPSSIALLATGLLPLVGLARRRRSV